MPVILAISSGMKYNCRLKTLRLYLLDLSSNEAAALGDGLSASQHLECLDMDCLYFGGESDVSDVDAAAVSNIAKELKSPVFANALLCPPRDSCRPVGRSCGIDAVA
jgi:hypothetical protein